MSLIERKMNMARKPTAKILENTTLANTYGGWMYCANCGENIGYLCYVSYDNFDFTYQCKCGGKGHVHIAFGDVKSAKQSEDNLISSKNRLCCPSDLSPLFTILEKKLISYTYEIDCMECQTTYMGKKTM